MGVGNKHRLKLRWSNIYAVVQKMIKISSKQSGIAFYRTVIVIYFLLVINTQTKEPTAFTVYLVISQAFA